MLLLLVFVWLWRCQKVDVRHYSKLKEKITFNDVKSKAQQTHNAQNTLKTGEWKESDDRASRNDHASPF